MYMMYMFLTLIYNDKFPSMFIPKGDRDTDYKLHFRHIWKVALKFCKLMSTEGFDASFKAQRFGQFLTTITALAAQIYPPKLAPSYKSDLDYDTTVPSLVQYGTLWAREAIKT